MAYRRVCVCLWCVSERDPYVPCSELDNEKKRKRKKELGTKELERTMQRNNINGFLKTLPLHKSASASGHHIEKVNGNENIEKKKNIERTNAAARTQSHVQPVFFGSTYVLHSLPLVEKTKKNFSCGDIDVRYIGADVDGCTYYFWALFERSRSASITLALCTLEFICKYYTQLSLFVWVRVWMCVCGFLHSCTSAPFPIGFFPRRAVGEFFKFAVCGVLGTAKPKNRAHVHFLCVPQRSFCGPTMTIECAALADLILSREWQMKFSAHCCCCTIFEYWVITAS